MKRGFIKSFLILVIGLTVISCKNGIAEFPDFDYTTCYFPWQFPVRTIVLGETDYDNSNDLNHQFLISATMGGVYTNTQNRIVDFEPANDLLQNLTFEDGRVVKLLPSNYYSFMDNKIVIPEGEISGGVLIQLKDAFFEDSLSYATNYVIPVRITKADTDSVLLGEPNVTNPDPRVTADWKKAPKDFTTFGVKYVNKYHGNYLLRGKATITNTASNEVSQVVYRNALIEKDIVTQLLTRGLSELYYTRPLAAPPGVSGLGNYIAKIKVATDGSCVISKDKNSAYNLSGTGKYAAKAESWGNKPRDVFYLKIDLIANGYSYIINDTLVIRDNTVKFEQFNPVVVSGL